MSLIAKSTGERIPVMEEGTYQAICTGIIDIGLQRSERFDKTSSKIIIMWSFPTEKITVGGEEKVRVISKEYTNNLGEKSNLTKDLQAWRGKNFTEDELKGFNLLNVLSASCLMQMIHKEKNGNKYAEIASIMALPKGIEKVGVGNIEQQIVFDLDEKDTWGSFFNIPEWIQNKIKNATNYESSGLKAYIEASDIKQEEGSSDDETNDDLPF